jgi:hypothetical protein
MGGAVDEGPGERFRRTVRFADLARDLGVDLPAFEGPLVAFDPAPRRSPGDPVYLGGDLHAVHPDGHDPGGPPDRDPSLDQAAINLFDGEDLQLEIAAIDGVWCTRLEGSALECAPYLSLTDGRGRRRAWLILPPAPTMIGIAHLWLPRVASLHDSPGPRL